jgi:hypothetical protein
MVLTLYWSGLAFFRSSKVLGRLIQKVILSSSSWMDGFVIGAQAALFSANPVFNKKCGNYIYILYLEGGSKSPKRPNGLGRRLARHFGAFFHHMNVRHQMGGKGGFYTSRLQKNEEMRGIFVLKQQRTLNSFYKF